MRRARAEGVRGAAGKGGRRALPAELAADPSVEKSGRRRAGRAPVLAAGAFSPASANEQTRGVFISSDAVQGDTDAHAPASPRSDAQAPPGPGSRQRPHEEGGPDGDGHGRERVHPHEDHGALALPHAEQLHYSPWGAHKKKREHRLQSPPILLVFF